MSSNHKMRYMTFDPTRHKARCECGQSSFEKATKQEVDDWVREHRAQVERVKAHLRKADPSLASQADYYRDMINLCHTDEDRALWKRLADELDTRLGRNAPPSEQLALDV